MRKRRTEVDPQLGSIVFCGAKLGVSTALTARVIEMIHEIEDGKRSQSTDNLDLLKEVVP